MSIFPRLVVPGSSITLHKRWLQLSIASDVKVASSEVHVRDPSGRSWWTAQTHVDQLPLAAGAPSGTLHHLAMSPEIRDLVQPALDRIVRALEAGEPLQKAARAVIEETLRHRPIDDLLEQILLLRASQHRYHTIPIPEDAALGRYAVELTLRRDGPLTLPPARSHGDWFCVERLRLAELHEDRAVVANDGPEPCEAVVQRLEHRDGWAQLVSRSTLRVPPSATVIIAREPGSTLLTYAEGVGRIVLVAEASVPRRSEHVRWAPCGEGVTLRLVEGAQALGRLVPGQTVTLSGDEAIAWLEADGYRSSSRLAVAEALVVEGLLVPLPTHHPSSTRAL